LALAALVVGLGCDDDGTGMVGDGGSPDGGGPPAACTATGMGTLTINVTGLPAGVNASVAVAAGSAAPMMVTATQTLSVPGGSYMVTATRVAGAADPIARAAYEPTVSGATGGACVRSGETTTVTVAYALIATSNRLWLSNGNAMAAMLAYAPSALSATGGPTATVAARTKSSAGFTFDAAGNLWALGSTTADPPVGRYAAASLGTGGEKTPDIALTSSSFGGGSPGPKALAFDRAGNLWSTVVWADKVVRFTPAQLAASGNPTAAVEIGGLNGPGGLAFDAAGNLWVTADGKVMRIDATRLAASGMGADTTITLQRPPPATGSVDAGPGLAFDATGNLWVQAGLIVRLTPADLAGTGARTVTPAVQIEMTVTGLPVGMTFDEGGGLWVASSAGKFVRYAPMQLAASGMTSPSVVISGADVGHADFFGIYPAPAALPLHHRLP
jgi:sugar lactone lactonase YvrE